MPRGGIRPICKVRGCERPNHARGLCKRHYQAEPDQAAWLLDYRKRPEWRAKVRAVWHSERGRARLKKWFSTPKGKAYFRRHRLRLTKSAPAALIRMCELAIQLRKDIRK